MDKMKYIIQILVAITLLGCTDEEIFKSKGDIEVTAGFAKTRTTFVEDDGVTHVTWNTGDAIGLFTKEQNNLQYTALNDGDETKFGALGEKITATEREKVYAYYPYSIGTENLQQVKLPSLAFQHYKRNASERDFIYAIGTVDNNILSLQFKHLFAFLKITIPLELIPRRGDNHTAFVVRSSEKIACHSNEDILYFNLEKEEFTADDFFNDIYYFVPSDEELEGKQEITCYIAILPQTENAEIKIQTWNDDGEKEYLIIKNAPSGGFRAGNVYTLYLNENDNETIRKKERDALIAFYNATDGDNWSNNENWCSDKPVSQWHGITATEGLVQSIVLNDNNLKGKILVSELANLSQLEALWVSNNRLTEIDLSYTPKIRTVTCENNWLTTLNISKNNRLDYLICSGNQIAVLDVSNKPELEHLHCSNNKIEKLDINNSPKLETLWCNFNQLSLLNIGNSPKLEYLECGVNSISTIDVSNLLSLKHLGCNDNLLTELDVHNNNQLKELSCFNNQIKSLDVSNCPSMNNLHCDNNQLSAIDISKNRELVSLGCCGNQITNIDISNNTKLSTFYCHFNELSSLDVSRNIELETLWCHQNQLSSLDVTMLPKLKSFLCGNYMTNVGNHLTTIDVSKNPLLETFSCYGMRLTDLDVSNNPLLDNLECSHNPISSIDVSNQTALTQLWAYSMNLSMLDISNNPHLEWLATQGNPNLSCIYIIPEQSFDYQIDESTQFVYKDGTDFYESVDYAQDGVVTTLQRATQGNGIDIVFMGDGYSDRLIADGTYNNTMRLAMDKFFSEEPYKSFCNNFNIYSVTAVSKNEGFSIGKETAFSSFLGSGTLVGGNDARVLEYAQKALPINRMDEALVIVMMNSTQYAGTCYMYHPSGGDYSNGTSIAYFPVGTDETALEEVLHHEAGGHGFAKLDDEYTIVQEINTPTEDFINERQRLASNGWWKNIDFTYNPMTVKWSKFLNDPRYAYDGLNVFEGASTFEKGVYRPTENSIMRYNTGGFNAPSREAIYYRIHKLAYGESWQYDYEQFVAYDAINRKANVSTRIPYRITDDNKIPLHAPVIVKGPWYKAKNNVPKQQRILPRNIHRSPQKITKVTMMDDAHESYIQGRETLIK